MVSPCSPGHPRAYAIAKTGPELRDPVSASSQVLKLNASATTARKTTEKLSNVTKTKQPTCIRSRHGFEYHIGMLHMTWHNEHSLYNSGEGCADRGLEAQARSHPCLLGKISMRFNIDVTE